MGRESRGESICPKALGGQKVELDGSVSTLIESVPWSVCGIGSRVTVFSQLGCLVRSDCKTSSPIRRSHETAAAALLWPLQGQGRCFGWRECGFRNDSSLQKGRFAACNGGGSGFNGLGCSFRWAMLNLPQPLRRCLTTRKIETTKRTPKRVVSSGCRRVQW